MPILLGAHPECWSHSNKHQLCRRYCPKSRQYYTHYRESPCRTHSVYQTKLQCVPCCACVLFLVLRCRRHLCIILTVLRSYPLFAESLDEAALAHAQTSHRNYFDSNTLREAHTASAYAGDKSQSLDKRWRPSLHPDLKGIPLMLSYWAFY